MNNRTRSMLDDSTVFSMGSIRGVVDRMVSGFFYVAPHSPVCARQAVVVSATELTQQSCHVLVGRIHTSISL